jgi:hypothetical protein
MRERLHCLGDGQATFYVASHIAPATLCDATRMVAKAGIDRRETRHSLLKYEAIMHT